jgi:uncharacterized protein YcaQ
MGCAAMIQTVAELRAFAVGGSLFPPTSLREAVGALGFVQYDPIRRPARAQDLILRQRVRGYQQGDLGRAYPRLGLEEAYLHVYGVMTPRLAALLDPRGRSGPRQDWRPTGLEAEVLAFVRDAGGAVHPRDLDAAFGGRQTVNAWGGMSAAATHALARLQRHGLLRISHREQGIKLYTLAPPVVAAMDADDRLRHLVLHLAGLLAPAHLTTLRGAVAHLARVNGFAGAPAAVSALLATGELARVSVDGVTYAWPAGTAVPSPAGGGRVRFLAPFDPVVWDRRRFEHLWGWPYRFEAYTPPPKRQYAYYALPLLLGERVVGWVEADLADGRLTVHGARVDGRSGGAAFRRAFGVEAERLARSLGAGLGGAALDR